MVHAPRSSVLLEIVLLLITSPHAAATAEAGSGSGFASGGVCADVAPDAGAHTALVGKHLVIGELWWGPFAIPDSTAPYGWTGFNIDLIEEMSEMLGFTFEIRDIGYPLANETWTTMIFRAIDDTDLTMSFWIKNGARLKQIEFLEGHIDFSPGLVARRAQKEDLSYWTWENLSSFMRPFTWLLWSALVGMVLVSGVADFIIERARTKDASLTASLYEYCAGFLWGGFEYPLSKASAVFQIILGFLLLIVVATYTANLASFIVLGAVPGLSCSSVETAMLNSKIIVTEDGGYLERISSTFPRLQYETVFGCGGGAECMSNRVLGITTPKGQGADAGVLADGALTPKLYYQQWKSSTDTRDTCSLEWVQTLFADTAGWVASRRSMCVRTAIEWAFYQLARRGTIERLHIKYFPAKQCGAVAASSPVGGRVRHDVGDAARDDAGGRAIRRRSHRHYHARAPEATQGRRRLRHGQPAAGREPDGRQRLTRTLPCLVGRDRNLDRMDVRRAVRSSKGLPQTHQSDGQGGRHRRH